MLCLCFAMAFFEASQPPDKSASRWFISEELGMEQMRQKTTRRSLFDSVMTVSSNLRGLSPLSSVYVGDPMAKVAPPPPPPTRTFLGAADLPDSKRVVPALQSCFVAPSRAHGLLHAGSDRKRDGISGGPHPAPRLAPPHAPVGVDADGEGDQLQAHRPRDGQETHCAVVSVRGQLRAVMLGVVHLGACARCGEPCGFPP